MSTCGPSQYIKSFPCWDSWISLFSFPPSQLQGAAYPSRYSRLWGSICPVFIASHPLDSEGWSACKQTNCWSVLLTDGQQRRIASYLLLPKRSCLDDGIWKQEGFPSPQVCCWHLLSLAGFPTARQWQHFPSVWQRESREVKRDINFPTVSIWNS